ncbi:MAG TPA: LptE family protein [Phnomibacter sp.]|nr:LptE family protein [Phnomibacter sp.]
MGEMVMSRMSLWALTAKGLGSRMRFSQLVVLLSALLFVSCKVYTFKDVSIPPEVKTVKVNFIENRARYVNPQLSPRLTDRLQQKIVSQTRLTRSNNDDADWVISGYVSGYDVTTSGISGSQASTNRLNVTVQITLMDNVAQKKSEYSVVKIFDFPAQATLQQAEQALGEELIRGVSDEIFNRIFSNW